MHRFDVPPAELKELLPLEKSDLSEWDQYYIYIAVFIATHRGDDKVLEKLLRDDLDLERTLPSGKHPLLVAVERRSLKCTEKIR